MPNAVARAVLDTNVLVSALISPGGPSAQLLVALRSGAFELVVSPLMLTELREVLARVKFQRYVTEPEIVVYVEMIRRESIVHTDPEPSSESLSVDPDDEYLIDLARDARVDALVSGDDHLLTLRHELPGMSPREFLEFLADT